MEGKQHKIDELLGEKDGLEKRISKLESKHQRMENEKNEVIKVKVKVIAHSSKMSQSLQINKTLDTYLDIYE